MNGRDSRNLKYMIWSVLIGLVIMWGVVHVVNAVGVRNDPPAACQLLGGSWNIWSGWSCQQL